MWLLQEQMSAKSNFTQRYLPQKFGVQCVEIYTLNVCVCTSMDLYLSLLFISKLVLEALQELIIYRHPRDHLF